MTGGVKGEVRVRTHGPAETEAVAGALRSVTRPGDVVLLIGELGAGKTAFAQGFAVALVTHGRGGEIRVGDTIELL